MVREFPEDSYSFFGCRKMPSPSFAAVAEAQKVDTKAEMAVDEGASMQVDQSASSWLGGSVGSAGGGSVAEKVVESVGGGTADSVGGGAAESVGGGVAGSVGGGLADISADLDKPEEVRIRGLLYTGEGAARAYRPKDLEEEARG